MPRRLDPEKGLPGLFAPGRKKTSEIEFLVDAPKPRRKKRRIIEEPAAETPVEAPVAVLEAAPPAVEAPPAIEPPPIAPVLEAPPVLAAPGSWTIPLSPREIPALAACALSWATWTARDLVRAVVRYPR